MSQVLCSTLGTARRDERDRRDTQLSLFSSVYKVTITVIRLLYNKLFTNLLELVYIIQFISFYVKFYIICELK